MNTLHAKSPIYKRALPLLLVLVLLAARIGEPTGTRR
jgi:hypothetical protein